MRVYPKASDALLFGLDRPVTVRGCDCPGCSAAGEYRAPKSRDRLTEYYWFCLDHVKDYNLNWDYFSGMNEAAIEEQIRADSCWQRETWPLGGGLRAWKAREQQVKDKVQTEFFTDGDADMPDATIHRHHIPAHVVAALAMLELRPPADFTQIKAQYKILVKRHHPDANGGSKEAEAKLKEINLAFTTLRKIYELVEVG